MGLPKNALGVCTLSAALLLGAYFAQSSTAPSLRPKAERADRVLVQKPDRRLTLYRANQVLKTYQVALGGAPVGHKQKQGDQKTPEGKYVIDWRNAKSQFYLSLHISYPNAADRARARKAGVDPGGDIMIHGLGKGLGWVGAAHRNRDWTLGCIAVTNEEIEEIWGLVPNGTPIEIRP